MKKRYPVKLKIIGMLIPKGDETARRDVKIVLDNMNAENLMKLYKKSPIYARTKEMFERKHEIEIFNYEGAKTSFKEAKMKEFQNIKLCNLFIQALVVNPQFKELRKVLKEFGYNLNIEFKEEKNERIKSDRSHVVL